jgi:hypothetical protein
LRAAIVVLLAACASPTPVPASAAPAPSVPSWQVRGMGGRDPIDVGTTDLALVDATGCATCHADLAAEHGASRHALAWTNGIFQREYQAQPRPWCVNCHAPMPVQQAALAAGDTRLADQGVNCATCHVRQGRIVAARTSARSPHDPIVEPSFGSPAFCADCHQFTFPVLSREGEAIRMTEHPMQDTVASFLRGPYAAEPNGCLTCHGSRTNHAFAGGHDADMLESALAVTWCRRDATLAATASAGASVPMNGGSGRPAGSIVVVLANVNAGHDVPTGDVHRHMNLRVWRSSAPELLYEGYLGRRFEPDDAGGKRTTWDSSIAPGQEQRHTVSIASLGDPDDPAEPINLSLDYVFIENEFPKPNRAPDEPAVTTVTRLRAELDDIARCPPVR